MGFRDILRGEGMEASHACIKELGLYPGNSGEPLKDSKQNQCRRLLWQPHGGERRQGEEAGGIEKQGGHPV